MNILEQRLKDAEAALRWYAGASTNLLKLYEDFSDEGDSDTPGEIHPRLGRRARAYFDKYPMSVYEHP